MNIRIILIVLALAAMFGIAAAASDNRAPIYVNLGSTVDWQVGRLASQYIYGDQQGRGWTIQLRTRGKVDGKPKFVDMKVSGDGFKPASISFDIEASADNGTLGIYDFDAGMPSFVMTNFSMGAHCCFDVKALVFDGQQLVPVDVGSYDGGVLVRDIDGDGTQEIDGADQRFLYAFDSYAGSRPARQIWKVRPKGAEDVTDSLEYQNYLVTEAAKAMIDCQTSPGPGNCAGALGTAARAGVYQSAAADAPFKQIDGANKNAEYLSCSKENCGVEMKFWNYREALEFQLNDWGYRTESSMTDASRTFFRKLAAASKGFDVADKTNAAPCGEEGVRFVMGKDDAFAELHGPEYACRIEKAAVLGTSAIGLGMCTGEGDTFTTLVDLEFHDDRLAMSWIDHGAIDVKNGPQAFAACR